MLLCDYQAIEYLPGWYVCLDAAGWVSSSSLDLSQYRPNFVALSFYKLFGYPTGLGALLIRNGKKTIGFGLMTP